MNTIPPWRQYMWLQQQQQIMPQPPRLWDDEEFEDDEDEGIDFGCKH